MTEIKTQTTTTPVAPPIEELDKTLTAMDQFMAPTNEIRANESNFTAEELVPIKERIGNRIIENDAINNISSDIALHRRLVGVNADENKYKIDVDVQGMHAKIISHKTWTETEKTKYGRAIQVLDSAKQNNLTIMRTDSGRYWFESNDTGEPIYAANGILEVKELLDAFYDPDGAKKKEQDKKENIIPENEEITPENFDRVSSDSDKWAMRGLGTDLISSLAAVTMKLTGVGAGAGVAVGLAGGITALGMTMYSDYLNKDVSAWEMFKNAAIRTGLEALETVTVLPASTLSIFKGASKAGKVIRRGLQAAMIGGTINAAQHADWDALWNKDMTDWSIENYRSAAAMAQFLVGFGGASAMRVNAKRGLTTQIKGTLKPKSTKLRADARKELKLPAKTKTTIGDAKAKTIKGEIAKNRATLVAKSKKTAGDNAAKREARVVKKGSKKDAEIRREAVIAKRNINKKSINDISTINKKSGINKKSLVKPKTKAAKVKAEKAAATKLKAIKNRSAKVTEKAQLARKKQDATTEESLKNNTKLIAKRKEVITKAKGKSEQARVNEHIKKEKTAVNKLVSKKKDASNKKISKAKQKVETKKQDILDAHGKVIGKKLIKRSENKALGKNKAEAFRKRAVAETKQEKKQLTDVERLKKERELLNKKTEVVTAKEKRGPNDKEKKLLEKKTEEIKVAEDRAKSFKGKADRMKLRAKTAAKASTGIGKKVLSAGATPLNALVARNVLSPAVKSMHANQWFMDRKRSSISEVKEYLVARGKGKEMVGKTGGQLRQMADKLSKTIKKVVAKKQLGGKLILKAQEGIKTVPIEDSFFSAATIRLLNKLRKDRPITGKVSTNAAGITPRVSDDFINRETQEIFNRTTLTPRTISADPTQAIQPVNNIVKYAPQSLPNIFQRVWRKNIAPYIPGTDAYYYGDTSEYTSLKNVREDALRVDPIQLGDRTSTVTGRFTPGYRDPNVITVPGEDVQEVEDAKVVQEVIDALITEKNNKKDNDPNITPEEVEDLDKKYDDLIAQAKTLGTSKPNGWKAALGALANVRLSDFISTNRVLIERPNAEDLQATVLHSRGVRNMQGFNASKNRTTLIPRVDTADSFAANMMQKTFFNEGEKRRAELVARNAQFVEKSRDEDIAIKNANITSAAAVNNMNISRRNQAESNYAASLVQAKAKRDTLENKRKGRIADGILRGITTGYRKAQRTKLNKDYNVAVALKSRWNTEYKPRFDKAVADGNDLETKKVKSEFTTATQFNVDDLDKYMLDTKAQYDNIL